MRRIALISDIHGNLPALDAVLADIRTAGVDDLFCLGDLVGYGPDPGGVVARVRDEGIPTIRGNYDGGVGGRRGSCGCYYATDQARADGEASYAFTDSALGDADHEWLAALPDDLRFEHDGARILLAHGSPRKINEYLLADRSDEQLARLAAEADADLVCVGHVHIPYHRSVPTTAGDGGTAQYVSSGSVGKPKDGDPRACWVELVLGPEDEVRAAAPGDDAVAAVGTTPLFAGIAIHRVAYDVDAVVAAMIEAGMPVSLGEALLNA